MKNGKKSDNSVQDLNPDIQAAELAVIAGLLTTLGDGIATIAAVLALQEAEKSSQSSNNRDASFDLGNIQKRLDSLERDMKHIKKILHNRKS